MTVALFIVMLYKVLKYFVRLGLHWYAPHLTAKSLDRASYLGPSIIVSNHPNSLMDALIIAAYSPVEIRFLTRGDIFKHPVANVLLRKLFQLPIYKRNDDVDYAVKNDFTFDECMRCLAAGKHILIFPEGRSLNTWKLQPFMNGGLTSLLERAYRAELPLQIQPYTLNYNSFQHVPKAVEIAALAPLDSTDYIEGHDIQSADVIAALRACLLDALPERPLDWPLPTGIAAERWKIPAKLGYYTQFWFYRLWRDYIRKKTQGTIFFDSLLFGVLLFTYPLAVLFCSIILAKLLGFWAGLILFIFLPATAYSMARYQRVVTETDLATPKGNSFGKVGKG